jgi:radical SAM protein with 4Fe4S-binding SPASM domain
MAKEMDFHDLSLWKKHNPKNTALELYLELTARCNNDCNHCFINLPANDQKARQNELTLTELEDIADQAVDLGVLFCTMTGGEPLLRPDFPDIYMAFKRRGIIIGLYTNGTLITPEHIKLFKKYPPRDIEVTVYGATKETYEAVTNTPGSFERMVRGLDLLREANLPVRLKSMAIKSNLHEQEEIAAFCWERTKDYYRFDPQLHFRIDYDQERNAKILSERLSPDEVIAMEKMDPKRVGKLADSCNWLVDTENTHYNCGHLFHCGAGWGNFAVGHDGRFRLCNALVAEGTTYDLRKGTLEDAYHNFVPKVRAMTSDSQEFRSTCRQCGLINLCYWCAAHADLETGRMDTLVPYYCVVAKKRAAFAREAAAQAQAAKDAAE